MNQTSATSQSGLSLLPDGIGAITAVHMAFMALVAIAAIAIIIAGIRRKRIRTLAERQVKTNAREAGVAPPVVEKPAPAPEPAPEPVPAPVAAPLVAPPVIAPPEPEAPIAPAPVPTPAPAPEPAAPELTPEPAPLADEPIAAAAPFDATPASVAADAPVEPAPAPAPVDTTNHAETPVTQLKGLGPKLATRLAGLGITTVGDLADLSEQQAQALDAQLGPFTGRMARDRWIEQARLLAAGDRAGFESVFGRL